MARKDVRVDIPVNQPDDTITLCKKIFVYHSTLGVGSPLNGYFDMADFDAKTIQCDNKRTEAQSKEAAVQTLYEKAVVIAGIAKGQNKQTQGTLYSITLSIRDFLRLKHRDNPEHLSLYGFDVVVSQTGGRRNVRINIPYEILGEMMTLCDAINAKHVADGAGSELLTGPVDMTDFAAKLTDAHTAYDAAASLRADKEDKNQEALVIIGYAAGQNSLTAGTLYNYITGMRDRLLNVHDGNEEELSKYGFNVVIGETSLKGRAKKPA